MQMTMHRWQRNRGPHRHCWFHPPCPGVHGHRHRYRQLEQPAHVAPCFIWKRKEEDTDADSVAMGGYHCQHLATARCLIRFGSSLCYYCPIGQLIARAAPLDLGVWHVELERKTEGRLRAKLKITSPKIISRDRLSISDSRLSESNLNHR